VRRRAFAVPYVLYAVADEDPGKLRPAQSEGRLSGIVTQALHAPGHAVDIYYDPDGQGQHLIGRISLAGNQLQFTPAGGDPRNEETLKSLPSYVAKRAPSPRQRLQWVAHFLHGQVVHAVPVEDSDDTSPPSGDGTMPLPFDGGTPLFDDDTPPAPSHSAARYLAPEAG
jgi:hypothetical protein